MNTDRNANAFWLRCILDEVLESGAQDAILSPGGRMIALSLVIRNEPRIRRAISHTDERSGAFIALGLARSTGRPVIVATTSGSAVANLVPALAEAHALNIPLILLTCDRPRDLRNAGYGQMIDHIGACRAFVAASVDLSEPDCDESAIIALREKVSAVVAYAVHPEVRGIVHINIPLAGLYDSTEVSSGWRVPDISSLALEGRRTASGETMPMLPFTFDLPHYASISSICEKLGASRGMRGLIVAGPECPLSNESVGALSEALRFPVIADAASGLRRPRIANLVSAFDVLNIRPGVRAEKPQLIIRLGLQPTLTVIQDYLLQNPCPTLRIADRVIERDYLHPDFQLLVRPDKSDLAALAENLGAGDPDWLACWKKMDRDISRLRREVVSDLPWGEIKAVDLICHSTLHDFFHFGNSMAIRNGDIFMEPGESRQSTFSNRGANGIDGTIGTFLGELTGTGKFGLLLIGDQAFLHDLPALAFCHKELARGCVCVINNGGGAIFDFLPASKLEGFENTIRTVSTIDMEAAAKCFGIGYFSAATECELAEALVAGARDRALHIIEVKVPPRSLLEDTMRLQEGIKARWAASTAEAAAKLSSALA